jgi:hypothetical protein
VKEIGVQVGVEEGFMAKEEVFRLEQRVLPHNCRHSRRYRLKKSKLSKSSLMARKTSR